MINLTQKIDDLNTEQKFDPKKKNKLRFFIIIFITLVFLILPLISIFFAAKSLSRSSKALTQGYKDQNFDVIRKEARNMKFAILQTDFSLNLLFWLRVIPGISPYYTDIKSFTSAGLRELEAVDFILTSLESSKSELGFNNQPLAGTDRVSQIVKILGKTIPLIDKITPNLKKAYKNIENVDINKYPEEFKGYKLKKNLQMTKDFITGAYIAVTSGKQAFVNSPKTLGEPDPKKYLLLFQNDKEIRATGGFITAYAILELDKGQIKTGISDDIYKLDEQLLKICLKKICPLTPPASIIKYLPEFDGKPRKAWSMRDSNLSPDLPTSSKEFIRMYEYLGEGFPFDGIIYIDTKVVESLIEITGEIDIYGTKYSKEIDPRCNCPDVIFELESYAEIAAKGEKDRKAVLGVLMQQVLARSLGSDIEKIPALLETIVKLAQEKHIMFYLKDEGLQNGVALLNWTGQIKNYDGDYLHINDSNFAGGKSNLYVDQQITQDINIKNGEVFKKITIEYKNPYPFSMWLNGINRDYVRFYVPKGSKFISSKGSEETVTTIEDLDKTVFEAFVTVRPANIRKMEIEYITPYKPNKDYRLLIQKQPGAKDFPYIIKINGKEKVNFNLQSDKELILPY